MNVTIVSVMTVDGENRDKPGSPYCGITGMNIQVQSIKKGKPMRFIYSDQTASITSTVQQHTFDKKTKIHTVKTRNSIYLLGETDRDVLTKKSHARKIKPASEKTVFQKPLKGKDVKALTHPSRQKDRKTNAAVSITKEENNAITVSNLCLNYKPLVKKSIRTLSFLHPNKIPKVEALKGVSFSVAKGEIVGIIGPNGSGKSTLLRTITGLVHPDSGSVDLHGNTISLLSLGTGFLNDISGRDNIILSGMLMGFSKQEILEKFDEIVAFSELGDSIDRPVRTYSSGMFSKLAFSIAITLETDILLIDEVLAVGDLQFKRKSYKALETLIKDKDRTVLIVSHNLNEISRLCSRVIWMEYGKIVMVGDPHTVIEAYHKNLAEDPSHITWLDVPTLHAEARHDCIHLSWNAIEHAQDYRLYRKENLLGSRWIQIADGYTGVTYDDTPPSGEISYLYTIRARTSNKKGNVWSEHKPCAPVKLKNE